MDYSGWELIGTRRFILTSWKDVIRFYDPVENIEGVKLLNISYTTPSVGNNTFELQILNSDDFNVGRAIAPTGVLLPYFYQTFLDPRQDAALYIENTLPVIPLRNKINQLNFISYEIYINALPNDPDVSPLSPFYLELGFFRKK